MGKRGENPLIERLLKGGFRGKRMSDVPDEDLADLRQKQSKLWIINDNQWLWSAPFSVDSVMLRF
jgi:hypothetical protein